MITTIDSMKLMGQTSDDKINVALPTELKEIAQELSDENGYKNISHWVKVAMIEKAVRDIEQK